MLIMNICNYITLGSSKKYVVQCSHMCYHCLKYKDSETMDESFGTFANRDLLVFSLFLLMIVK